MQERSKYLLILRGIIVRVPDLVHLCVYVLTETANMIGVHFVMSTIVRRQHISECMLTCDAGLMKGTQRQMHTAMQE